LEQIDAFFVPSLLDNKSVCPEGKHVIHGSPLAHEAFLRRDRGTYGMAWAAGSLVPQSGVLGNFLPFPFPNLKRPVDGLLRCGDSEN
jgi:hypothetical protein